MWEYVYCHLYHTKNTAQYAGNWSRIRLYKTWKHIVVKFYSCLRNKPWSTDTHCSLIGQKKWTSLSLTFLPKTILKLGFQAKEILFFYWVLVRWRRNLKTVLNSAKFLFKSLATRFLLQSRGGARNFWLGVQTLVQKGLLNFFCGKLELLLTDTTTRFSICERQSLLAREILLCKQTQTHHRQLHYSQHS